MAIGFIEFLEFFSFFLCFFRDFFHPIRNLFVLVPGSFVNFLEEENAKPEDNFSGSEKPPHQLKDIDRDNEVGIGGSSEELVFDNKVHHSVVNNSDNICC